MYLPVSDEVALWISLVILLAGLLLAIADVYRRARIAKRAKELEDNIEIGVLRKEAQG
jgi:predicted histidine transporter YuiF (NhaC family)